MVNKLVPKGSLNPHLPPLCKPLNIIYVYYNRTLDNTVISTVIRQVLTLLYHDRSERRLGI